MMVFLWFLCALIPQSGFSAIQWLPVISSSSRQTRTQSVDSDRNLTEFDVEVNAIADGVDEIKSDNMPRILHIVRQIPEDSLAHESLNGASESATGESASPLADEEQGISSQSPLQSEPFLETSTSKMDELIELPRNNCNLEIRVHEAEDRQIRIQFEPLKKGAIGQCQITLNGEDDSMLAVLITEIRLRSLNIGQRACDGFETLRAVLTNTGINFTLKQYCGDEDHYPVLLTDTNRVYLVLSYNGTNAPDTEQDSSFALEVFSYHKYENNLSTHAPVNPQNQTQDQLGYPDSGNSQNVDNIYITTMYPDEEDSET